jgi:hypothetical protein
VTLSATTGQTVTVDYASSDGTAVAIDDYTTVSGTLSFGPGETLLSFDVPVNDDSDEETPEIVDLTLSAPANAVLGTPDDQATLTITDNDTPPAVQYTLTVGTVGNGSVSLNPPGDVYTDGTVVTLTPLPGDVNWEFSSWSGDLIGSVDPETVTMTSDKTVTATFTLKQYTLVTATVGNGSVTLDPPGGTYDAGTVVTLTATAGNPDYEFSGWGDDLSGSTNPITMTMDTDKNVTATFTLLQYDLATASIGSGGVSLAPSGGAYDPGIKVAATAAPSVHWEFQSWSGALIGSTNPQTITMDADKAVTATFTLKQYSLITATVGNGNLIVDPPGGVYDALTEITLTASPDPNKQFLGWSGGLSGTTNPITLTMDSDKTVTATFGEVADVTFEGTVTGGSSGSNSVATSGSVPAGAGDLYLAAVSTKKYFAVTSVNGMGLTWRSLRAQCAGRNATGVDVWWAQGSPTPQAVTATLAGAPANAIIAVSRYSGVESLNPAIGPPVVSANTNGVEGGCSGGSDSNSYSVDLTTTANNSLVYGVVAIRNKTHEPGPEYIERIEATQGTGGSRAAVAVEDKTVDFPTATVVDGRRLEQECRLGGDWGRDQAGRKRSDAVQPDDQQLRPGCGRGQPIAGTVR